MLSLAFSQQFRHSRLHRISYCGCILRRELAKHVLTVSKQQSSVVTFAICGEPLHLPRPAARTIPGGFIESTMYENCCSAKAIQR